MRSLEKPSQKKKKKTKTKKNIKTDAIFSQPVRLPALAELEFEQP
jgi:hypothetical protein